MDSAPKDESKLLSDPKLTVVSYCKRLHLSRALSQRRESTRGRRTAAWGVEEGGGVLFGEPAVYAALIWVCTAHYRHT